MFSHVPLALELRHHAINLTDCLNSCLSQRNPETSSPWTSQSNSLPLLALQPSQSSQTASRNKPSSYQPTTLSLAQSSQNYSYYMYSPSMMYLPMSPLIEVLSLFSTPSSHLEKPLLEYYKYHFKSDHIQYTCMPHFHLFLFPCTCFSLATLIYKKVQML